ncbi:MAG: hypothetical protein B7733_24115 [Myxococcales bacterium FL481]|nr:MAG: hypothetical protein B7733_24115 [Myxococcales bacterium FL481]
MTPDDIRELLLALDQRRSDWETLRASRAALPSLAGIDLTGANLSGVDLADLDLSGARLGKARMRRARLRNTNLTGAQLGGADLVDADFDLARLRDADLSNARLASQNLSGMDLRGADLRRADLRFAYLGYANLEGAQFNDADLTGADLTGASLTEAQLLTARTDENTRRPVRFIPGSDPSEANGVAPQPGGHPEPAPPRPTRGSPAPDGEARERSPHPATVNDEPSSVPAADHPGVSAGPDTRAAEPGAPAQATLRPATADPEPESTDADDVEPFRSFLSDNTSGLCPEALAAITRANDGAHVRGYGDDVYTQRAELALRTLFGATTSVFFVATGTAANTLAIAALTQRWETIVSHRHSHLHEHESTGPELITGCRNVVVGHRDDKIEPADLDRFAAMRHDVHQPQPGVLTLSNPTEFGTVYRPGELRALCKRAHELGFRVHVDGARFANAVAALDCDPKEITTDVGVDALSFGGTKNGLAGGEAVVFFPHGDGRDCERAGQRFPFLRKQAGHLVSKHRFLAAPFEAVLADNVWLRHAGHANDMAARLADGLARLGHPPAFPCETNSVFVRLAPEIARRLRAAGHRFYNFGPAGEWVRLICSFDTRPEEVDAALTVVAQTGST